MCRLPHFINNSYGLHEKAASLIREAPAQAGQRKPLAGTSKSDNIHGRQLRAVQPGNVAHMNHIREVAPGDGYALRYDLAGPQGADAVKRSGIGETSYAVKK